MTTKQKHTKILTFLYKSPNHTANLDEMVANGLGFTYIEEKKYLGKSLATLVKQGKVERVKNGII